MSKYYVTTPIFYPNARPHVGTAFMVIGTDVLARFHRLLGDEVYFLTGTDEHGEKNQKAADQQGVEPQALVDGMVEKFKAPWEKLSISYDGFIRTSEPRHQKVVQELFQRAYDRGDIYKGTYEGLYCTPCESYWAESEAKGGECPQCGRPVRKLSESAYFFALSKYQDRLEGLLRERPDFIQPDFRRNEMVANFLKPGLRDVCISRSSITWGVPVPVNNSHVVWVWFDALPNYLSGIGYLADDAEFRKWWPADVHIVGKDIVRFHTLLWPAMLMAAGLEIPERVYAHGFVVVEGTKMSKSLGNVVLPEEIAERYGADALRYYLMREIPFWSDGSYSEDKLVGRFNHDLGNDLGNLVLRTLSMIERYFEGKIPPGQDFHQPPAELAPMDKALRAASVEVYENLDGFIDALEFNRALESIWGLVRLANRYVEENRPWVLAKDPQQRQRLSAVLYNLAEACRVLSVYLSPFMPTTCDAMRRQFGLGPISGKLSEETNWGQTRAGTPIARGDALFPRVE